MAQPENNQPLTNTPSAESLLMEYILALLQNDQVPSQEGLPPAITNAPHFTTLVDTILGLRTLTAGLAHGDLNNTTKARGYIAANLKSLQANLRHLSWQVKQIAKGDYNQKVDFMGDFSDAFNEMTQRLTETTAILIDSAFLDSLTGIPNRQWLKGFSSSLFENGYQPFCVLMIDIDHFKQFNDTYGHHVGDEVLAAVAKRIQSQVRKKDHVARYGGEEFIAILSDATLEMGQNACCRIINNIAARPISTKEGLRLKVTVSIGLSERCPADSEFDTVVKRSDKALYDAKNSGRNRYCIRDVHNRPFPGPAENEPTPASPP